MGQAVLVVVLLMATALNTVAEVGLEPRAHQVEWAKQVKTAAVLFSAQVEEVLAAWVLELVARVEHGELTLLELEQLPQEITQTEQMVGIIFLDAEMAEAEAAAIIPMEPTAVMAEFQAEVGVEQVAVIMVTPQ